MEQINFSSSDSEWKKKQRGKQNWECKGDLFNFSFLWSILFASLSISFLLAFHENAFLPLSAAHTVNWRKRRKFIADFHFHAPQKFLSSSFSCFSFSILAAVFHSWHFKSLPLLLLLLFRCRCKKAEVLSRSCLFIFNLIFFSVNFYQRSNFSTESWKQRKRS